MKKNRHAGGDFDEFLREEEQRISKSELARRMRTSRSALDRLLDPQNPSVTLQTLERAAQALGKRLRVEWSSRLERGRRGMSAAGSHFFRFKGSGSVGQ